MQKIQNNDKFLIFVGSYTEGNFATELKGDGLSCFFFDSESKTVHLKTIYNKHQNLSFLSYGISENNIFAVSEIDDGNLISLAFDENNYSLKEIDSIKIKGDSPCHIHINNEQDLAIISNYSSGSFSAIIFDRTNGKFINCINVALKFDSIGPVSERQDKAHAHCVWTSQKNGFIYVSDLGGDKIHIFYYNNEKKSILSFEKQPFFLMEAGSGPRHLCGSNDERFLYCVNELKASINVFIINLDGSLNLIQKIGSIPDDFKKSNYGAEIKLHPDNKFLFVSNRGFDSLSIYSINQSTGVLTLMKSGYQSIFGRNKIFMFNEK